MLKIILFQIIIFFNVLMYFHCVINLDFGRSDVVTTLFIIK